MQLPNYLTVDNPNIPVLAHTRPETVEYGRFFESSVDNTVWPNGTAQIKLRDMYLPNFSFRVIEAQFTENAAFYNAHAHGSELLGSCVFFQARMKSILPGEKDGIDLYHRTHNFKYDPDNEYLHLAPANTPLNFVHFSYTIDYLNQILPENEPWAETLKARIDRRERVMGSHALPISLVQEHALHNIFNCPLSGKLGEMMIETSIVQLILLQLHGLFGQSAQLTGPVSKQDVGIIHALKDHLANNS